MGFTPGTLLEMLNKDKADFGDIGNFRFKTLMGSILKKFVAPGDDHELSLKALEKFSAFNKEVANFRVDSRFLKSDFFGQWRSLMYQSLYNQFPQSTDLNLATCLERGSCGPGASIGSSDPSFYRKMFDSPLTTTRESLLRYYRARVGGTWAAGESLRHAVHGSSLVAGSRMATVPKNKDEHRTICVEPTLNMFYQLGAKSVLEDILANVHRIDLRTQQDVNKSMAQEASLLGNFATLDLKMASDSMSLDLMKHLLPPAIFTFLDTIRSHETSIAGRSHVLGMISTMGNGFTFPLMTLVFVTLIKAVMQVSGCENKRMAVFGDDLIVPTEIASRVCFVLRLAGFTVNTDKSFSSGPFRESCGGDYYKGHDVRGIYLKEMSCEAHVYSLFNRLHFWSIRHGIPLLSTLRWLQGLVKFRPVPCHASFDSGFITTADHLSSPKRTRSGGWYYNPLEPVPRKLSADGLYNEQGALTSFLGGYIRNYYMLLPTQKPRYRPNRKTTPSWDSFSTAFYSAVGSSNGIDRLRVTVLVVGLTSLELSKSWDEILISS